MDSAPTAAQPVLVADRTPHAGSSIASPDASQRRSSVLGAAVALVIAVGMVLRFWTRSHLWLDEALTVNIARLPLRDIPAALRHDGAPPLYYFLLHGWMRIFGTSDAAVRSLGGVLAVATLPFAWLAGRRAGGRADGRTAGVVAVLLLASSPFAVRYATEARMYSLVILLTVLGYLLLCRVLDAPRPASLDLVGLALVSGLLLLTHYWALYLLAAVAMLLALQWRRAHGDGRRRFGLALAAIGGGSVMFVPWLPTLLFQIRHTGTPWAEPASFSAMVNAVSEFAGGRSSTGRALGLTFFALAGFGLFGSAIDRLRVEIDLRTRRRSRGLAFTAGVTLAMAIAVGFATRGAFAARYAAVVFAPFLLLVALGATVFTDRRLLTAVVAAAVAFGLATSTGNVTTDRTQAGEIAAVVRRQLQPGDVIGYCPDQLGPATSRLLPAGTRQVTFPRRTAPELVDWVDYGAHNRAADPAAFARFLDRTAGSGHTVWMVWAAQYRTLGSECEEINAELSALRPQANQLLEADTQRFFEHANLTRYLPR